MWDSKNNNKQILKLCPFCNSKAKEYEDNEIESIIECTNCGVSMYTCRRDGDNYVERCRILWNRRTNDSKNCWKYSTQSTQRSI